MTGQCRRSLSRWSHNCPFKSRHRSTKNQRHRSLSRNCPFKSQHRSVASQRRRSLSRWSHNLPLWNRSTSQSVPSFPLCQLCQAFSSQFVSSNICSRYTCYISHCEASQFVVVEDGRKRHLFRHTLCIFRGNLGCRNHRCDKGCGPRRNSWAFFLHQPRHHYIF